MLIQKNVKTSFLCNAGRRRSSANGWSASYQLLDKTGNVIFPAGGGYSTQDLQEIGNGLWGVAIILTSTYCGFIRWKISDGITDIYSAEPFTILSSYGNKNVEQTFLANFSKSRVGKSVDYRILREDLSEERTWNDTGLFELGSGMYGVSATINESMTGFIEWRNNTDTLYVSDPILVFDSLNPPVIQTGKTTVSVESLGLGVSISPLSVISVMDDSINITILDNPKLNIAMNKQLSIEAEVR